MCRSGYSKKCQAILFIILSWISFFISSSYTLFIVVTDRIPYSFVLCEASIEKILAEIFLLNITVGVDVDVIFLDDFNFIMTEIVKHSIYYFLFRSTLELFLVSASCDFSELSSRTRSKVLNESLKFKKFLKETSL